MCTHTHTHTHAYKKKKNTNKDKIRAVAIQAFGGFLRIHRHVTSNDAPSRWIVKVKNILLFLFSPANAHAPIYLSRRYSSFRIWRNSTQKKEKERRGSPQPVECSKTKKKLGSKESDRFVFLIFLLLLSSFILESISRKGKHGYRLPHSVSSFFS